ncbi:MAG: SDR family oxidoreductase [Gammaproteobacteria bacterium]|nr:SDR family oxidoreductase [Gammaproteobacteria bacterium]
MSEARLEGKVALITGGASGIGRACAIRFAEEGADIVVADLNVIRAEETIAEIQRFQRISNRRAMVVEVDVASAESVEQMADRARSEFGRIDTAVIAAGIANAQYVSGEGGPAVVDETANHIINNTVENWNRVLAVNLTGVMLSDRAVARHMIDQGDGGTIVNIASIAARIPLAGAADYCVSKAGVAMLTNVLAVELAAHNIRVNAIGPGFIETPMTAAAAANEEGKAMMVGMTPMGRLGRPEEIANAALYLACDESSYTTGQTIFPNGGMNAG